MFRKSLLAVVASLSVFGAAVAAPPVSKSHDPNLDPITNAIVVTCHNQLAFVAVVFEDGSVTIYDKQSGVPAQTALLTASKAKSIRGYEACATAARVSPNDPSRNI